jgi:hypothetical protein
MEWECVLLSCKPRMGESLLPITRMASEATSLKLLIEMDLLCRLERTEVAEKYSIEMIPEFGGKGLSPDILISSFCQRENGAESFLGGGRGSYGGPGPVDQVLFGETHFRVVDYEVFKTVIE